MSFPTSILGAGLLVVALQGRLAAQEHHTDEHAPPAQAAREEPETKSQGSGRPRIVSISKQETKGGPRWSVLCEATPIDELMRALAKKTGLALVGLELLPFGNQVSIELERRPLEQVLAIVIGTQGLRHEVVRGTLRLLPPSNDPSELLRLAQSAWNTVEAEGDEHAAASAKLAQGNLAEVRGDLDGAYHIYAELAEEEHSPDAPEATYRAGRILERLGHWAEAAQHFRVLAALDGAKSFHAKARLELARVSIELGDAKSALHILNFLDANFPTEDSVERAERRLVRARALTADHEWVEALRTLESGEVISASDAQARSLAIRAEAFEGLGFEVEAARAWLIFAREAAASEERVGAFENAVRLSLAGGDELGVLFLCREAAKAGADEGLGAYAHQARLRLGLEEDQAPASLDERLALAEERLAGGDLHRAADLFEGLYLARGALDQPDQARVIVGWAQVLVDRVGLEGALEVLARNRSGFEDPLAAQALDLAAAHLLEAEGRYDEAVEAYRGVY
jgi:tetratricopeptide (TPR) repeat protein